MHELILLRHAQALPAEPGGSDLERPLSARGHATAHAAGHWLARCKLKPQRVLCSPARRTRETLAAVNEVLPLDPPQFADEIYDATPGELLALLDRQEKTGIVLLVGHNPSLERLLALLVEGRSDACRGMPTAGIAVLHLERGLEPASARLEGFWSP